MKITDIKALAKQFKKWGLNRVKRVQEMTKKYGVILSTTLYSDGKRG